jgi:hypothetical protein
MTGNQKDQKRPTEGALIDASTAYLVCPRFYNDASDATIAPGPGGKDCYDCSKEVNQMGGCEDDNGLPKPGRMYFTPGDRLYHGDKQANDLVINKELMQYSFDSINVPMFPIVQMDAPIIDSRGILYTQGRDYDISCDGNIVWKVGGANPGIDPDTGAGRTYSIRYLYRAFYYVSRILREVRITDVTVGNVRQSERAAYFIEIVREYIFRNINNGNETNQPPTLAMENRQVSQTPDIIKSQNGLVRVETTDIENDT